MSLKGVISFVGDMGREPAIARTQINAAASTAALETFAAWLKTDITDCNLNYTSFIERTDHGEDPPGTDVDVDLLAVFVVKEATAGSIHKFSIPGPKADIIENTPLGRRILAADQVLFATNLSGLTGLSFSPVQGYIIEKK